MVAESACTSWHSCLADLLKTRLRGQQSPLEAAEETHRNQSPLTSAGSTSPLVKRRRRALPRLADGSRQTAEQEEGTSIQTLGAMRQDRGGVDTQGTGQPFNLKGGPNRRHR